jgi:sodium/potassium-transporting ATPase subunit beta
LFRQKLIIILELSDYRKVSANSKPTADIVECGFDIKPGEAQICQVKAKDLMQGACTQENKYGYQDGTPCILLKVNRVRKRISCQR